MDPARDQVVSRAFRSTSGQEGGLYFDEVQTVEELSGNLVGPVAQKQVALHVGSPQVEIAVFEACFFSNIERVVRQKGRGLGDIEDADRVAVDLDGPRFDSGVDHALRPGLHDPLHRQNRFVAQALGLVVGSGIVLRIEDYLSNAVSVPQVYEDDPAVVAPARRPTHEGNICADLGLVQGTAVVAALPVAQRFDMSGYEAVLNAEGWVEVSKEL